MSDAAETLHALRQAFDRAFAEPVGEDQAALEELIVVRVGQEHLALRLTALSGIERVERVVPLPDAPAALSGLAGLRGRVVPVFSLASLLGVAAEPSSGWIAVVGLQEPVGLAFDALVGVVTVEKEAIVPAEGHAAGALIPEAARLGAGLVGVLRVESVVAALATSPLKEEN